MVHILVSKMSKNRRFILTLHVVLLKTPLPLDLRQRLNSGIIFPGKLILKDRHFGLV